LVPPNDFMQGEIANIHYFGEVITPEDLQKAIVQNGLSDKVAWISDLIGLSNAAKYYQAFLWFHGKMHGAGSERYSQFILRRWLPYCSPRNCCTFLAMTRSYCAARHRRRVF
jgi:hypothetical protein